MKNRYGVEYHYQKIDDNKYTVKGDLKYWRYGGHEGQERVDFSDLRFVDPSGGPFISIGMAIEGRKITHISVKSTDSSSDQIIFEVE
jgi:hypothetical protein